MESRAEANRAPVQQATPKGRVSSRQFNQFKEEFSQGIGKANTPSCHAGPYRLPVIHSARKVGYTPLRGIVIEFKAE
jgi:hypothetical protein